MQYLICLVLLALLLLAINLRGENPPTPQSLPNPPTLSTPPTIRQTTNGPIEGIQQTSRLGQTYYAFHSIPYGEAPITGIDPYTGKPVDRRFKVFTKPFRSQLFKMISSL